MSSSSSSRKSSSRDKKEDSPRPLDTAKLYIANLSERTKESDLEEAFRKFGKIRDTRIIIDSATGRPKGFAFITMESPEEGRLAQQEAHDKMELDGKRIIVEFARGGEKQNRRPEPYDRRGPKRDSSDSRDRRDYYPEPKYYYDDRDRRDRVRNYDLPHWSRDYPPPPWPYGREPWRDPHDFRDPYYRRDDRDSPYPSFPPYPLYPPPEYFGRGGDRRSWERDHRDWDRERSREYSDRNSSSTNEDRSRDREDYSRSSSSSTNTNSHSTSNGNTSTNSGREKEYRKDERYENKDSRTDSHSGDRHNSQDRRRS